MRGERGSDDFAIYLPSLYSIPVVNRPRCANPDLRAVSAASFQSPADAAPRESEITLERVRKILATGANVILTTKGIDDLCLKEFVEAGAMAVRRCRKEDLRRIARATGATLVSSLANLEGDETFEAANLGFADEVVQERISDDELILVKGTKVVSSSSIILRGANDYMLDEMERALHDALSIVKRTLESGSVVPGGGAVETALSIYLENFATTLVSDPAPPPQMRSVRFSTSFIDSVARAPANNSPLANSPLLSSPSPKPSPSTPQRTRPTSSPSSGHTTTPHRSPRSTTPNADSCSTASTCSTARLLTTAQPACSSRPSQRSSRSSRRSRRRPVC